uniref:dynamin GTPase n=1 Tax=Meloidogyne enterolobii TaxID=390850 RepID=A0A6V7TKD0_MELEN|nr:unnamed protein product [Meloidogyne enterolobii]
MESLIPVISKLQDVFATIGCRGADVELPQIVVIGSQSSGKSSALEGIVGRDFLPRGVGIVTRRPLILHLSHSPLKSPLREQKKAPAIDDWAEFGHAPGVIYTNFDEVREEIERETDRLTGSNKGISPVAITLTIYSQNVVNLSLVDLPGITKVPVGDQPPDIEVQIRKMLFSFISNPNSIILAVMPANQDFATSESLKIAREVDKEGNRTLVLLTKLDLMDQGTDAMDVLTGRLVPVKLGIIGIVNRSQADIIANKSIKDCLKDESKFLQTKYPTLASMNGIPYLTKQLNRLLMHHIRECLPQLKIRINTLIVHCQTILRSFGEAVVDKNRTLLNIITHFSTAYNSTIDGTARNIETTELCGGARICYIFHETFTRALEDFDPLANLNKLDVLTAIRNATGLRPSLFIPEVSFELLVKKQIERLEEPAITCVDLVYEEMLRIVQHCGIEVQQEMQRFPFLYERIHEVINHVLSDRLPPTKEFVSNLVSIQLAYINTKHPEFASDASLINSLQGASSDESMAMITEKVPASEADGKTASASLPNLENGTNGPSSVFGESAFYTDIHNKVNLKKLHPNYWFNRNSKQDDEDTDLVDNGTADGVLTRTDKTVRRPLSVREKRDIAVIERLIKGYFIIVRKSIQDLVPKAIMNFLVNNVKENLQSELVRRLYNADDLNTLLSESDAIAQKRAESAEMLKALNKANMVISEIRETHIW